MTRSTIARSVIIDGDRIQIRHLLDRAKDTNRDWLAELDVEDIWYAYISIVAARYGGYIYRTRRENYTVDGRGSHVSSAEVELTIATRDHKDGSHDYINRWAIWDWDELTAALNACRTYAQAVLGAVQP